MTNPSSNEGAVSVVSAARLREIAAIRLACAQAMLALASQQPSVLSAIDAAAQGELGQGEADDVRMLKEVLTRRLDRARGGTRLR